MALKNRKAVGVREAARLTTLASVKRTLKSNALAIQILKDQRTQLLDLKATLETKPNQTPQEDPERPPE